MTTLTDRLAALPPEPLPPPGHSDSWLSYFQDRCEFLAARNALLCELAAQCATLQLGPQGYCAQPLATLRDDAKAILAACEVKP